MWPYLQARKSPFSGAFSAYEKAPEKGLILHIADIGAGDV
jgi:hypothetical protein